VSVRSRAERVSSAPQVDRLQPLTLLQIAPMTRAHSIALALLFLAAQAASAATINRCTVNGRTVYQQTACANDQAASAVELPAPPPAPVTPRPAPRAAATAASAPAPALAGAAAIGPSNAPGMLDGEAALCLDYLRPLLLDPASATVSAPSRDGRVLRLKVSARDGRGRLQQRDAACEIVSGRVDDGWTQIQLKRLGWLQARPVVVGDGLEAQRQRRALEGDIEAPPKAR